MSALLIKDFHVLLKQLGILLLITFAIFCFSDVSVVGFPLFYVAMMPITALAYDERSHWDELANMMPYSVNQLVGSKYVLGLIHILGIAALSILAQLFRFYTGIERFFLDEGTTVYSIIFYVLIIACLALLVTAILLPFLYRFGTEKGRLIFLILLAVVLLFGYSLADKIMALPDSGSPVVMLAVLAAVTALALLLSWRLSVRFYRMRRG